jgi:hypothetical protein
MTASDVVAVFAILISVWSVYLAFQAYTASIRPALVVSRRSEPKPSWYLENVGNDPAVSVVIQDTDHERVRHYPIAAGDKRILKLKRAKFIVAYYQDADRAWYQSRCEVVEKSPSGALGEKHLRRRLTKLG